MRLLSLTAVLAGSATFCAVMALAETNAEESIRMVIEDQMAAFQANDTDRAFEFASPAIRAMFADAERFSHMVQQGYPMVWRAQNVRYLGLREEGAHRVQRIMVRDASENIHFLDYRMIEDLGVWRIDGVALLRNAAGA